MHAHHNDTTYNIIHHCTLYIVHCWGARITHYAYNRECYYILACVNKLVRFISGSPARRLGAGNIPTVSCDLTCLTRVHRTYLLYTLNWDIPAKLYTVTVVIISIVHFLRDTEKKKNPRFVRCVDISERRGSWSTDLMNRRSEFTFNLANGVSPPQKNDPLWGRRNAVTPTKAVIFPGSTPLCPSDCGPTKAMASGTLG